MSGLAVYAGVLSADQRAGVGHLVVYLVRPAGGVGLAATTVVSRVEFGLNGHGSKLRSQFRDPSVAMVVVEHRGRLARLGVGHLEAGLAGLGRRLVVVEEAVVADMVEVVAGFCARRWGRRSAQRTAARAVAAAGQAA